MQYRITRLGIQDPSYFRGHKGYVGTGYSEYDAFEDALEMAAMDGWPIDSVGFVNEFDDDDAIMNDLIEFYGDEEAADKAYLESELYVMIALELKLGVTDKIWGGDGREWEIIDIKDGIYTLKDADGTTIKKEIGWDIPSESSMKEEM